jgi:hypothetical protein
MIDIFVIYKGSGLSNQRINHVSKVDEFFALAE